MKVLLLFFLALSGSFADDVIVVCKFGKIRGTVFKGMEHSYEAFLGVPYAKPPVGALRFRSPVPCAPWEEVYDATYARNECLQKTYHTTQPFIKGDEDCLYLNIYRPCRRDEHEKLPVIVYFGFGGIETALTSPENISPDYFMDTEKVIIVVVQSRLGALGYLSSGDLSCLGNFGLKDQALALKWIHENIAEFQGDNGCITLLGDAAGATATQIHWVHQETSKLFHRVILKSGGALMVSGYLNNPKEQFLHHANCTGIENPHELSSLEIIEKLRKVDAKLFLSAYDSVSYKMDIMLPYRVVIEVNCPEAYITEDPRNAWELGYFVPKSLYVTFTPFEGNIWSALLLDKQKWPIFNQEVDKHLLNILSIDARFLPYVKKFYFEDQSCKLSEATVPIYINMITNRNFYYSMYNMIKWFVYYVDTQKFPLSIDEFAFNGPMHFTKYFSDFNENLNTGLGDDMLYIFRFPSHFPDFGIKSISYQLKNIYVDSHVNFALTGSATCWTELEPCTELYFDEYGFCKYQIYGNDTEITNGVQHDQITIDCTNTFDLAQIIFWDKIDKYN